MGGLSSISHTGFDTGKSQYIVKIFTSVLYGKNCKLEVVCYATQSASYQLQLYNLQSRDTKSNLKKNCGRKPREKARYYKTEDHLYVV